MSAGAQVGEARRDVAGAAAWTAVAGKAARLAGIAPERLGAAARKVAFGLADDGLASTATFVLSFLLARWLLPGEYGLFALLYYSGAAGAMGLWGAVLLLPMSVLGPGRHRERLAEYVAACGRLQRRACLWILGAGGAAAAVLAAAGRSDLAAAAAGLGAALAGLAYMQFARRAAYVFRRPEVAVVRSAVYVASLAGGVWLLGRSGHLGAGGVLAAMGAAGFLAGWATAARTGREGRPAAAEPPRPTAKEGLRTGDVLREIWGYGRWTAAGNALGWAVTGLPYVLSAGLLGLAGTGTFQAGMNFVKPGPHVFTVFLLLALPHWAERHARLGRRAAEAAVRWSLLLMGGSLLYGVAVLAAGPLLFAAVYHGRYAFDPVLAGSLMAALVFQAGTVVLMAALQAAEKPQAGVAVQGAALAAGLLLGPPAVRALGLPGLGLWAAAQALAQLAVAAVAFRRVFGGAAGAAARRPAEVGLR